MEDVTGKQLGKDIAFYRSCCFAKRLLDENLITQTEFREIIRLCKEDTGTRLIV